ncbi:DUF397 domain-containing protein [Streptomonospora nanhaiensis]|uniref:DUF397 domain-containing protein n=1 Tax=Streptomonospora nanhaiensis TaxID=1323731 RepID=A0ABY6YMT8_9ACTN|nr:DUF397 domain-containing protein [Streptomonospora nanhaiensis]WAE73594.1 DUF397 domain-containing protein [Streptomonospora nanhaiensis]
MSETYSHPYRKSSYSGTGNNCVEVADTDQDSAMRDTQNRDAGALSFPRPEWSALLSTVRQK